MRGFFCFSLSHVILDCISFSFELSEKKLLSETATGTFYHFLRFYRFKRLIGKTVNRFLNNVNSNTALNWNHSGKCEDIFETVIFETTVNTTFFVSGSSAGQRCDTVFDGCKGKPCRNGGTCAVASNTPHGFICKCPPVSTHTLHTYTHTHTLHTHTSLCHL